MSTRSQGNVFFFASPDRARREPFRATEPHQRADLWSARIATACHCFGGFLICSSSTFAAPLFFRPFPPLLCCQCHPIYDALSSCSAKYLLLLVSLFLFPPPVSHHRRPPAPPRPAHAEVRAGAPLGAESMRCGAVRAETRTDARMHLWNARNLRLTGAACSLKRLNIFHSVVRCF